MLINEPHGCHGCKTYHLHLTRLTSDMCVIQLWNPGQRWWLLRGSFQASITCACFSRVKSVGFSGSDQCTGNVTQEPGPVCPQSLQISVRLTIFQEGLAFGTTFADYGSLAQLAQSWPVSHLAFSLVRESSCREYFVGIKLTELDLNPPYAA